MAKDSGRILQQSVPASAGTAGGGGPTPGTSGSSNCILVLTATAVYNGRYPQVEALKSLPELCEKISKLYDTYSHYSLGKYNLTLWLISE